MYYTVNGDRKRDYVFNKKDEYVREYKGEFNPLFKKAVKKREDKIGKKCINCFTIKSLAGKCECDND